MIFSLRVLLVSIVFSALFSCNSPSSNLASAGVDHFDQDRPNNPWVFRSVLDAKPRIITMALHDNMYVAYQTDKAAIYKAWKGLVNFDGAVYTTNHGPQPTSLGDAWFINQVDNPWKLKKGTSEEALKAKYKGHSFEDGHVQINYELTSNDGQKILVTEQPEYAEAENGMPILERIFSVSNVPAGAKVVFYGNVGSITSASKIDTDGELTIMETSVQKKGKIETNAISFSLVLNNNASTKLNSSFVNKPMINNPNKADWDDGENSTTPPGFKLIAKNDCKTCHNTYRKTIGPAYVDVAKKYRNNEAIVTMLTNKVKMGGSGVWGQQVMNAHPNVSTADITAMIEYIMTLDAEEEAALPPEGKANLNANIEKLDPIEDVNIDNVLPGATFRLMKFKSMRYKLANVNKAEATKIYNGIIPTINLEGNDFKGLQDFFSFEFRGYLNIPEDNVYEFRLVSDDGSNFSINNKLTIDNDGQHGADAVDQIVGLKKGLHPFKLNYFQDSGGKSVALYWREGNGEFSLVPATVIVHSAAQNYTEGDIYAMGGEKIIPGDQSPLDEVHPSYDLSQARPDLFTPKVGGMDFLPDGRLVVSTWDADGGVYIVENYDSGDPEKMSTKLIAKGLAEPLGLRVVDGVIYVLQKQELTKLIDTDGDDYIDVYETVANSWNVSANFHEFAFGLAYKDGFFYGTLATAINPGGASTQPQIQDRGRGIKINKLTGEVEFVGYGFRTPNGIGIGYKDELFVCDNQGDWLPSSKMVHLKKDAFYGSRSVDFEGTEGVKEKLPVIWMPQDEIGNSPSTPIAINDGPYKDQMIYCEVTHGGVKRVFVEEVDGELQGCLFRFIQGLEAGVNRMEWGPDGALYVGGIGSSGNWRQNNKLWYGLQKLKYNGKSAFEMLAVRAKSNGIEIEFTEALKPGDGWNPASYDIEQFYYLPTPEYGGPKRDLKNLKVKSASVSNDRKKVFLELDGMKSGHVVYVHLAEPFISELGHQIWTTEAWYTMNSIPKNNLGTVAAAPAATLPNTLSDYEKQNGWELLFDGKTTNGWRNFKKETVGSSWQVENGTLTLSTIQKEDGGWQAKDGGDIITEGTYENYEFTMDWKISSCGNSGIIYNVHESDEYDYVWMTGPEMQILDNSCHPDAKIETHRAGDLYDMISCKYVTVNPAGQWNQVRVKIENGQLEHWLNGYKVVSTTMFDDNWKSMIANSKFKDMKGFGTYKKGHISLQDHGDRVWFRNIKIKNLTPDS